LVKEALEESQQEMMDSLGTIIYGDGTGNSSKDFLGLTAIVDDGTNVATYGTLARSTYTTIKATLTAFVTSMIFDRKMRLGLV
jgi:hypothetical protein